MLLYRQYCTGSSVQRFMFTTKKQNEQKIKPIIHHQIVNISKILRVIEVTYVLNSAEFLEGIKPKILISFYEATHTP